MIEFGSLGEILIISVVALIVIGPKEIPNVLRNLGRWTQRLRSLSSNLRQGIDHYIQEGEFEEYQKKTNHSESEAREDLIIKHKEDLKD